jgi:hypothetical protein
VHPLEERLVLSHFKPTASVAAGTFLSGVVQTTDGHPIGGVPIEVGGLQGVTRADGSFHMSVPPAGFTSPISIPVPKGDASFDPNGTGTQSIPMARDRFDPATGTSTSNPLQHPNVVTSFMDASMIYGSDPQRAAALRTLDGTGHLKTSPGDLLPLDNATYFPNGPLNTDNNGMFSPTQLFVAGDVRANENTGLLLLHTLFVREHNRLADQIRRAHPDLTDDQIYQQARRVVGAEIEHITYNEYLPLLLGRNAIPPYRGYKPKLDPTPGFLFTTAAFRFAHSQTPATIAPLDSAGRPLPGPPLSLADTSFDPMPIEQVGVDALVRGLIAQRIPKIAPFEPDDSRNLLFGPPGAGGIDLVAVDIQRGRDLGLPTYNQARQEYGLRPAETFAQITKNADVQSELQAAYGSVDKIDAIVGMLAEDHRRGAMVGPLLFRVIRDQFEGLRNGDRYWYENGQFTKSELAQIRTTTFAGIIARNTGVTGLKGNAFTVTGTAPAGPRPGGKAAKVDPTDLRSFDGSGNNVTQPLLGSTGSDLRLDAAQSYADGISAPAGPDRPSARVVSNVIFSHVNPVPDPTGANLLDFFWGQFLTHDIDLTPAGLPNTIKVHGEALGGSASFAFETLILTRVLGHAIQPGTDNVIPQPIVLSPLSAS